MSYQEYLEWADEDVHAEWVDGKVIVHKPPTSLHQALIEANVPSVLVELPEVEHGFDANPFRRLSPAAQAAEYDIARFLALMV
jgi:acetyl esterase/lipase